MFVFIIPLYICFIFIIFYLITVIICLEYYGLDSINFESMIKGKVINAKSVKNSTDAMGRLIEDKKDKDGGGFGKIQFLRLYELHNSRFVPITIKKIGKLFDYYKLALFDISSCYVDHCLDLNIEMEKQIEDKADKSFDGFMKMGIFRIGNRLRSSSCIWSEFEEGQRNHFTVVSRSRLLTCEKNGKQTNTAGNMFAQLDNHESFINYQLNHGEFQHGYTLSQNKRRETARRVSSLVVSAGLFLGTFFNIWSCSLLSIANVPPLHKEHGDRLSIWPSLLGLFGFMTFVCAVAVMILVGAPFNLMQKAMLIFLVILMHLQSANSINALFVPIVVYFSWSGTFGKNNQQMNAKV